MKLKIIEKTFSEGQIFSEAFDTYNTQEILSSAIL